MMNMTSNNKVKEEEIIVDTYPRNFKRSTTGLDYEYVEMREGYGNIRLRITFYINKDRLAIIEDIIRLKYCGFFSRFTEEAFINQIENDINSPETIAIDYCKGLQRRWFKNFPVIERKSLQDSVDYW